MKTKIKRIAVERLLPHPDNPNWMPRASFAKLVRHIEASGRYEPLVVRPYPGRLGFFQILNGHHRCEALKTLGHKAVDTVVWYVTDEEADMLLVTLNRLNGRDILARKLALLRRLSDRTPIPKLAKLVPQTRGQLERLTRRKPLSRATLRNSGAFAAPLVFFVDSAQQQTIEEALSLAIDGPDCGTKAVRRAAALTRLAQGLLDRMSAGSEPAAAAGVAQCSLDGAADSTQDGSMQPISQEVTL